MLNMVWDTTWSWSWKTPDPSKYSYTHWIWTYEYWRWFMTVFITSFWFQHTCKHNLPLIICPIYNIYLATFLHLKHNSSKLPQKPCCFPGRPLTWVTKFTSPSHANASRKRWSTHWRWSGLGTVGLTHQRNMCFFINKNTRNINLLLENKHLRIPGIYIYIYIMYIKSDAPCMEDLPTCTLVIDPNGLKYSIHGAYGKCLL